MMISPSAPEPLCDIEAQFRAVCNPRHPKQAMWIASGTAWPTGWIRSHMCGFPEGILVSRDPGDALMLRATRDDRTLADILGYLECKWSAGANAVVVRALDDDGCVVTEFAVSPTRVEKAYQIVRHYGNPELTTIPAVLERRRILCAAEAA